MTPSDVLTGVHASLHELEGALISGRADRVLEAEGPLSAAAARLARLVAQPLESAAIDRRDLRRLADTIQRSMARAQAMGAASAALVTAMLPPGNYGPRGLQPPTAWSSATVATRT